MSGNAKISQAVRNLVEQLHERGYRQVRADYCDPFYYTTYSKGGTIILLQQKMDNNGEVAWFELHRPLSSVNRMDALMAALEKYERQ